MITVRAFVPVFALWLGLNARCQDPLQSAPAVSKPASGQFANVEGGKLYFEECGTGPDAEPAHAEIIFDTSAGVKTLIIGVLVRIDRCWKILYA